jgi:hypothetical protein
MRKADFKSAAFTNFATPAHVYSLVFTAGSANCGPDPARERFGNEREIPHRGRKATPEIVPKSVR